MPLHSDLTIGSDPEFGYIDKDGKQRSADDIQHTSGEFMRELGTDGHSSIAEIRAHYGRTPLEHCDNIESVIKKRLVKVIKHHLKNENIIYPVAGSIVCGEPIGGHIHLGHPLLQSSRGELTVRASNVCTALDYILAPLVLLVEKRDSSIVRKKTSYGGLGDCRITDWGIEYRAPSSWLVSKGFTKSVLCTAYTIAHEALRKGNAIFANPDGYYKKQYRESNKSFFKKRLPAIFSFLKSSELFPLYSREICSLVGLAKCWNYPPLKNWEEGSSFLPRWGVDIEKVSSEKIVTYLLSHYCSDLHVSSIVEEILRHHSQHHLSGRVPSYICPIHIYAMGDRPEIELYPIQVDLWVSEKTEGVVSQFLKAWRFHQNSDGLPTFALCPHRWKITFHYGVEGRDSNGDKRISCSNAVHVGLSRAFRKDIIDNLNIGSKSALRDMEIISEIFNCLLDYRLEHIPDKNDSLVFSSAFSKIYPSKIVYDLFEGEARDGLYDSTLLSILRYRENS